MVFDNDLQLEITNMSKRLLPRSSRVVVCLLIATTIFVVIGIGLNQNTYRKQCLETEAHVDSVVQMAVKQANKRSNHSLYLQKLASYELESCKKRMDHLQEKLDILDSITTISVDRKPKLEEARIQNELKLCKEANDLKFNEGNNFKSNDKFQKIDILMNDKEKVGGLKIKNEVYVPFSYVREHYNVFGNFTDKRKKSFKLKHPDAGEEKMGPYSPTGIYSIGNLKATVAYRSKVKLVDGVYEVPVSNQWDKAGYFYPIQISQFGLAHFSAMKAAKIEEKEDNQGSKILWRKWKQILGAVSELKKDRVKKRSVLHFDTSGGNRDGQIFQLLEESLQKSKVISFNIKFKNAGMVSITVAGSDKRMYKLNYISRKQKVLPDRNMEFSKVQDLNYDVGSCLEWRRITRDLNVDLVKGLQLSQKKKSKGPAVSIYLDSVHKIALYGVGSVYDMFLNVTAHDIMFTKAADWLVKFQDPKGGWSVNVTRKFKGVSIDPGWYSAMGQGQAISLLCRVHNYTNNQHYLDAALKAVDLFEVPVEYGGIVSQVMGGNRMYEEYPSTPSFHVLNGFIFSLIGLYDLGSYSKQNIKARSLFRQGYETLLRILPLYDTGHETYYDLGHVVMPGYPPNRARADYHAVHLRQLQLLMQIKPHKIIQAILKRWRGYAKGVLAPHN